MPSPAPIVVGMKAWTFEDALDLDHLALRELPDPEPGPHDVVLRLRAASLNYRDLAIARGMYGKVGLPRIPVSDAVGEVVAVGRAVTRFQVGDRASPTYVPDWIDGPTNESVARRRLGGPVDGVLAELLCVPEHEAVRAPSHLDDAEAASLPIAYVTAWQALAGTVFPGQHVIVQGTGGVSIAALQVARMLGARVTLVARDGEKLERAAAFGGTPVVMTDDWPSRTGRADLVFDIVGGAQLARSIAATRVGGTVILCGFVGGTTSTVDLFATIRSAITLRAISGGSRASFEAVARAMEVHDVHPPIDRAFPFERAKEAYAHLENAAPLGKVAILGPESR